MSRWLETLETSCQDGKNLHWNACNIWYWRLTYQQPHCACCDFATSVQFHKSHITIDHKDLEKQRAEMRKARQAQHKSAFKVIAEDVIRCQKITVMIQVMIRSHKIRIQYILMRWHKWKKSRHRLWASSAWFTAVPGASDRHGCTGGRVTAISGRDWLLMPCDFGLDIDILMIYVEIHPRCFTWLCHCLEHPGMHANWCNTIYMKVNQKMYPWLIWWTVQWCWRMCHDFWIRSKSFKHFRFWGIFFGKLVLVQYTVPYKHFVLAGRAWPPGGQVASQRGSSHWVEMCFIILCGVSQVKRR